MNYETFLDALTMLLAMSISIGLHEAAHAFTAKWEGDDTAEKLGRTTLNPIPHIAPLGLAIPVLMVLFKVPMLFGWGKPVPVQPSNFRHKRWGNVLVSAAGPLTNLVLCFISIILFSIYETFLSEIVTESHFLFPMVGLLRLMVYLNAALAIFNLIPLPPLDGGYVLPALLPKAAREFYDDYIAPNGFILFIVILVSGKLSWIWTIANGFISFVQAGTMAVLGS